DDQHRYDGKDDQPQPPVDAHHEIGGSGNAGDAPGDVQQPPRHQLRNPIRVAGHPAHNPAYRRAVEVAKAELLQVVEQPLAQVIAYPLAEDTREVDEGEDGAGLHEGKRPVQGDDAVQRLAVARLDPFVDDA